MSDLDSEFRNFDENMRATMRTAPPLDRLVKHARTRQRRRRVGATVISATVMAATVSTGWAVINASQPDGSVEPSPAAPANTELTPEQVRDLTAPGRVYDSTQDFDLADTAFLQRWGGVRPEAVSDPLVSTCQEFQQTCGGVYYDASSLTFHLRVVGTDDETSSLADSARDSFNAANGTANFKLDIVPGSLSLPEADRLVNEINDPALQPSELKEAGFAEGSYAAGYDPEAGVVTVGVFTPAMKDFFEDLYGDKVVVNFGEEGGAKTGGFAAPEKN